MLASICFLFIRVMQKPCNTTTPEKAIDVVSNLPDVKSFLKQMHELKQPVVFIPREDSNTWVIRVAEDHSDHIVTHGYYTVDFCGNLKK